MSKNHNNRYALNISPEHAQALLEGLYIYQMSIERDGTDEQKYIAADLVRRAELLESVCKSGQDFYEAQRAYRVYCRYGDRPHEES